MSNENLQKWASVAEIIAAFAVVLSLVYVAFELRSNTLAIQATSRQEATALDIAFISASLDPLTLAEANVKRSAGDPLTPLEEAQLRTHQHINFRIFENSYYQYSIGALQREEWERYFPIITSQLCNNPYARQFWGDSGGSSFNPEFRNIVNGLRTQCE